MLSLCTLVTFSLGTVCGSCPGNLLVFLRDGNLPDIVASRSLHEFLVNLHEKYGPVVSFWFGRRLVVSIGSIDLLKQHINPNRICKCSLPCL